MPEHRAIFVNPANGNRPALLQKAFETLQSREINPEWIDSEIALKIQAVEKYSIYVVDPFEGDAFKHLEHLGCRVYGPPCVLSCTEAEKPLPKQHYPQYSLSMRGLLVCFSNIENDERDRLMEMVRYMGGEVMKVLTEHVTHLVTNQVGSKKYIVATSNLKIPIMLPEWVDRVWATSKQGKIHAANEDFKKFGCPIFAGVHVTVSGLDHQERKRVQVVLEENGGKYSGEMRRERTTHLITTTPKGQKYSFATKWKINIVHPQWLHDSLHSGYCRDECLYMLDSMKTSTPTKDDPHLPSLENMSSIMSTSMMNVTSVNDTMNSTNARECLTSDGANRDVLDELELKSGDLLDGCKVYLSGFCGDRLDKIRKYVGLASGTRFSVINEDLTHVIVNGKAGQSLMDEIKELQCPPHVVSVNWLVESQKTGILLPEEEFSCLEKNEESFSPIVKRVVKKEEVLKSTVDNEMSDLLSQYISNDDDTMRGPDGTDVIRLEDNDVTRLEDNDVTRLEDNDVTKMEDEETTLRDETETDDRIFASKSFVIVGFDSEGDLDLRNIIRELGGRIHDGKSRGVPHYAVVPPFGHPVKVTVDEVVTSLWVQQCHEDSCLLELDQNVLYRPITINSQEEPLKSCVLAITGYTGMERDCLLHLAKTLGAVVQEYFCKKTSSKAQASTHLLASVPDGLRGSKFEAATKMSVPVVTKEWLLKCAETGVRQPESEYDPVPRNDENGESVVETTDRKVSDQVLAAMAPPPSIPTKLSEATPTGKCSNQRVLQLQASERNSTSNNGKTKDLAKMTPNTALANIEFDLSDMLQEFDTPASQKKHKRNSSLPLEDLYHHHINIALRRFEHPEEFQSPQTSTESHSQDSEDDKPLRGVVLSVCRKLADKQSEYFNMVSSLGGDYRWTYDSSCTHYMCQGRVDSSKEYRMAREKGKYIVSPYWLLMCEQQNSRVDEGLFPANFNPNMSLSCLTTPGPTPVTRRQARMTRSDSNQGASPTLPSRVATVTESAVSENQHDAEAKTAANVETTPVKSLNLDAKTEENGSLEMQQVLQKELEDIMANSKNSLSNSAPRRKSRRPETGNRPGRAIKTTLKAEEDDTCSQQAEVTWDDPNSRKEREKFVDVLHKPYSPTQNQDTQDTPPESLPEPSLKLNFQLKDRDGFMAPAPSPRPGKEDDKPPPTPEPPSLTFPRPKTAAAVPSPQPLDPPSVHTEDVIEPKFLLSGMTQEEKDSYGALIETLGGTLLESNTFDIRCTHLIAGQPTRNEKCLASIASGKWILHKSYLEACKSAGHFVKEDDHEWGNACTLAVKNPQSVVKLSEAAHRWRVKLQHKCQGAFYDWKVIICTPKSKTGGFKRLLEAGSAKVLCTRPPFSGFLSIATHAFMDLAKCEMDVDLDEFSRAGVPCYKPEFIAGFLMDEFVDTESYVIAEIANNNSVINAKKRKGSGTTTEIQKKSKIT